MRRNSNSRRAYSKARKMKRNVHTHIPAFNQILKERDMCRDAQEDGAFNSQFLTEDGDGKR